MRLVDDNLDKHNYFHTLRGALLTVNGLITFEDVRQLITICKSGLNC